MKKKALVFAGVFLAAVMLIPTVYAWYWVCGDNFNDNSLAACWTVIKSDQSVSVQETEQCIKITIPSDTQEWTSGGLKRTNDTEFGTGLSVWVDVTSWGGGGQFLGPKQLTLVLSNEIYSPMSAHRRYTISWEAYNYAWPNTINRKVWATEQIGDTTYQLEGFTLYDMQGPDNGYTIGFNIEHLWDEHYGHCVRFYYWDSCVGGKYHNSNDPPGFDRTWDGNPVNIAVSYDWIFSSNPYPIFDARKYDIYNGIVKYDDFNIFHQ